MIVGIPKEIKDSERRVAVTPDGVAEYVRHGHRVIVEQDAGLGSGFSANEYESHGAILVDSHAEVFARADLILKVKEPVASEYGLLRPGQVLFTYLHLAADEPLTNALVASRAIAVAYETVQIDGGALPLLTPMSEVAGRMSVQVGAQYLQATWGGGGRLLAGVPGVPPAKVTVVGGGVVGTNAAQIALGMGASVTIVDINVDRLRALDHELHGRFSTLASNQEALGASIRDADLLIGAVLVAGARAPKLVSEAMVSSMRQGSVLVDVAIDQGGCIATSRPTSHSHPTFVEHGVIHYCVTNMPGAVPRTSTQALTNATLPYGMQIASQGLAAAARTNEALAKGINVYEGVITHEAVARAFDLAYVPVGTVLH